ncbi:MULTISPECIES: DUF4126 domain-containing protein [Cyanophyceae]|uniref:DUF4126 domain-containing protein n=1 Tax=Cyanophyceae TaxID=3028117 RepID=UPI00168687CA|nr:MULTISPECIES: DUF4126 domain-containing protein [Cyanophyceae]MBD1916144.1 DUF4126 domain-containing protein [Phormidium sp. FACHB-77]MBD2031587.1 DUF4126 domain-containing protein [Phormidium sp. FACHB-322]MBD2052786.1 DUF4126 domain-containing protein [Leptolyngbya sp. FACHB-60]
MDLSLMNLQLLESIGLGLGLGVAAGFRVVVPFWVLSAAALFGHLTLASGITWLGSTTAFVSLSIALVVEILAYSVPWLDNVIDTVALPVAAVAGTLLMAIAANQLDPFAQWSVAIVAGGGAAATVKGLNGLTRLVSTATTGGATNLIIAGVELVGAIVISLLALVAPIVMFVLVLACFILLVRFVIKAFYRSKKTAPDAE